MYVQEVVVLRKEYLSDSMFVMYPNDSEISTTSGLWNEWPDSVPHKFVCVRERVREEGN